jgi:Ca2+-binding EF-hand superfamily protein
MSAAVPRAARSASPAARSPSPPHQGHKKGSTKEAANQGLVPASVLAANSKEAAELAAGEGPIQVVDTSHVPKNAKGGVLVTAEELRAAYEMLDTEKTGFVTQSTLRKRLGFFFPEMTPREYRFLMNNHKEITYTDLEELLMENEISNFDPVAEAFKLYDPENEGSIPGKRLRDIFESYGFGEMSHKEFDILLKTADINGDGKITLADFRALLAMEIK